MRTPQHIGIVGCSAEGAALCYRTVCAKGAQLLGPHAHPEITMHTHSLAAYVECIERNDWSSLRCDLGVDLFGRLAASSNLSSVP
jgi:aspartate racemase